MSIQIQPNVGNGSIIGFWIIAVAVLIYSQINCSDAQGTGGGAGNVLQDQLDAITARLDNISATLNSTEINLTNQIAAVRMTAITAKTTADKAVNDAAAAQAAANMAQADIDDELKPALANVTLRTSKLVNINKTWKTNFRVVNETFILLRKKLSFRAPHIPLS